MNSYKFQCLECNELFPESINENTMINHIEYYHKNLHINSNNVKEYFSKRNATDFKEQPNSHIDMFLFVFSGFVFCALILLIGYYSGLDEQNREAEKQLIIKMDCFTLKDHIIKDDLKYHHQGYLETEYEWRCK